jgi:uncharacterized protein DUF4303
VGDFELGTFRRDLARRTADAVQDLRRRIGSEHLYGFALFTSGESGYAHVRASANSEEGLARRADRMAEADTRFRGEAGRRLLRWNAPEWAYHDFSEGVRALALPDPAGRRESLDAALYEAFVGALKAADRAGLFGRGAERAFLTVNVLCDHPSPAFFRKGLARLNPVPTVERHEHETSMEPFARCVNRAPRRERMRIWLALYEDLYMEWKTPIAEEARARGYSPWEVEEELVKFGPKLVPRLVDMLEHYGYASAFDHNRGLETREVWLAGCALFLARRIGLVAEKEIARLQKLVEGFVERDRRLRVASTLAENVARVLHELRPRRFPPTVMDPLTHKLLNPEPYLLRPRSDGLRGARQPSGAGQRA